MLAITSGLGQNSTCVCTPHGVAIQLIKLPSRTTESVFNKQSCFVKSLLGRKAGRRAEICKRRLNKFLHKGPKNWNFFLFFVLICARKTNKQINNTTLKMKELSGIERRWVTPSSGKTSKLLRYPAKCVGSTNLVPK